MIQSAKELSQKQQKRRGRPGKKVQQPIQGDQLFTIHDNVFHASILFYTFRVFDKTPSRSKFNPTIGFSIYEKVKGLSVKQKEYYNDDDVARKKASEVTEKSGIINFYINCLTFGPCCVLDEFFDLFKYILQSENNTPKGCLQYIKKQKFKFINFNCNVMENLGVKILQKKVIVQEVIELEILKLFEILIHTLNALKYNQQQNIFAKILQSQDDMFERGINTKPKNRKPNSQ